MKVLIDIDDKDYTDIITDSERNLNHYERLIKKGVPQITGHEDCISRKAVDELSKELVHTTRDKADFLCNFWEGLQKLHPVNPQEPILDKIRAEIEQEYLAEGHLSDYWDAIDKCLQIVDKYKAESEE